MRFSVNRLSKLAALGLALALTLLLLLSSAAMVLAVGHHCTGSHCEICLNLHQLAALLRQLTLLWGFGAAFQTLAALARAGRQAPHMLLARQTPVRLCVRMND